MRPREAGRWTSESSSARRHRWSGNDGATSAGWWSSWGSNSLFRSDHYFNGSQKEAIDVYLSFVMAAEETERVRFGTDSRPHPPPGRPPILIGGTGPRRTLRLVAEHAAEWNATPLDPVDYAEARRTLERHCEQVGRDPSEIRRSMLLFATIGPDRRSQDLALARFLDMIAPPGSTITLDDAVAAGRAPWRGSPEQLVDHVGQLGDLGLDEVVFEHFCHEEDTIVEWIASEVKPQLAPL